MAKRAIVIVLDSVGIGEMEDSCLYGDEGSNTLKNVANVVGGLKLSNLEKLGLGNIEKILGLNQINPAFGAYGKMGEKSKGKDTTIGHWEMMGIILDEPFPVFPNGFPVEIINSFERKIGKKTLGNIAASGTEIIEVLGLEHMKTGFPIVYTSADSVFQIAAHEEIVSIEKLYHYCQVAREILSMDHAVGRVIARPFIGEPGAFKRTSNRHDYSISPTENILDRIYNADKKVIAVGKIKDIFTDRAISESYPTKNNSEGVKKIKELLDEELEGLIFANLIDFDQNYGHRNDIQGYAKALEEFDLELNDILEKVKDEDILFITADHGCDPTMPGTNHTREYVPLLVYGKRLKTNVDLGTRDTFADLGATIADYLDISSEGLAGTSFCNLLRS